MSKPSKKAVDLAIKIYKAMEEKLDDTGGDCFADKAGGLIVQTALDEEWNKAL